MDDMNIPEGIRQKIKEMVEQSQEGLHMPKPVKHMITQICFEMYKHGMKDAYWRYPSSYDNAFNAAYEYCNNYFPEKFIKEEIPYNESHWIGNITFVSNNFSIFPSISLHTTEQKIVFDRVNATIHFKNMECEETVCDCFIEFGCMTACLKCKPNNTKLNTSEGKRR